MEIVEGYLEQNKDFLDFLTQVSNRTGEKNTLIWNKNIKENSHLFKDTGWACPALQDVDRNKTAVIMGASPAIRKQASTLWELQSDKDFVLCGLSSNLEWLLNNDIHQYLLHCIFYHLNLFVDDQKLLVK